MFEQIQSLVDVTTSRAILRLNWVVGSLYINRLAGTLPKQWITKRMELTHD